MIAAFLSAPSNAPIVHIVHEVVRDGFKVKAHGYCGTVSNAADGTYQVPDWAFDGRSTYRDLKSRQAWQVCSHCIISMKNLREPQR